MVEVSADRGAVNVVGLDAALRGAGLAVSGVSCAKGRVRVHFVEPPSPDEAALALELVAEHDPAALTAEQAARAAREVKAAETRPAAVAAVAAYDAALEKVGPGWSGLDGPGRVQALRELVLVLARLVRWLVARELG